MKKLVSLLLLLVMVFSFTGCLSDFVGTTTTTTTTKPKQDVIERGVLDGAVYTNDAMKFKFTRPASWVYSTDEEISSVIGIAVEEFGNGKWEQALSRNIAIYDMMVIDTKTNSNIIVGYENLKKSFSSNITEEQYIDALKNQYNNTPNMNVVFPNKNDKVKLGETEFTRVICQTTAYGIKMTQIFYLHKMNGYMGYIIVTLNSGYTVEDIEAMFE